MNLQHLKIKIFVAGDLRVDMQRFIEVFHDWVASQSMDEMLIDVADYRHVPNGPGVVLIGHEADYAMDQTGGRFGLIYSRKAPLDGSNTDRLRQGLRAAAKACLRLETELASLEFSRHELAITINDRALAPNSDETDAAFRPILTQFLQQTFDANQCSVEYDRDPRRLFGVAVKFSEPIDLQKL
jgi:hypothetical protein